MRISDWSSDVCSSDLLWNADGTLLASATFTNETASGWQTANLNTPVAITAGTTYIASSHTGGDYSATGDRKSVVEGTSVYIRVDLGGVRIHKKKQNNNNIIRKSVQIPSSTYDE